jgi:hypothetical protein
MIRSTKGKLDDGTVYLIQGSDFIINGKVWFSGTESEIEEYIKKLNIVVS